MVSKSGYGQFCPVAKAAEVLAVKWTPVIIRELLCGSYRFNDLKKGVPLMSPSLLSTRLQELEDASIVRREPARSGRGHEYYLTEAGEALRPIIEAQGLWAQKWLEQTLQDEDLDPSLLIWDMHRNIDFDHIPDDRRFTVYIEISGVPANRRRWWMLMENEAVDVCLKDPGYEVDVFVAASMRTLAEIWMGQVTLRDAESAERLFLDGTPKNCAAFRKCLKLSHYAKTAGR